MEKINYSLLCFQIHENAVLGILVGTEVQVVDKTIRQVRASVSNFLQKQYKKDGYYPNSGLGNPVLRMLEVSLKPAYRKNNVAFPLSSNVKLRTPLVYSEEEPGVFACYLPMLEQSFYCYDAHQLESLSRHFIINAAENVLPEAIYQYIHYPEPRLEVFTLKVKKEEVFSTGWKPQLRLKNLQRLAERYPHGKSTRQNQSAFPEAAWELEEYTNRLIDKLSRQKASVLVVGNSGVGKSAVIRQAVRKIAVASKKQQQEQTCWRIQAQRFTATSKYLGEWQEVAEELVWELVSSNGYLWVEDVVQLLSEGGSSVEDSVAAYLLAFIQQGKLQLVAEVTPRQLESIRRLLPGFVESVQLVEIPELPDNKTDIIFEKFSAFVRQNLKVRITKDGLALSKRLLKRFYPYESFPGKGIRFLSECVNEAQLANQPDVTRREVIKQFIRRTGLPELFLRDDLLLDQKELEHFFSARIIGQKEGVQKLCDVVKVFKAGLNNPHKPITTLIFAGPTGVGKTASANALAAYFFSKGQKLPPLIRIDMSEFQHSSRITRFIGSSGQPGTLVGDVRERPFSVLLLDEAEKAAPSIFDAFLTVLDEGKMVDAYGRVTNFRNCIIILTTNLGASNRRSIGYGDKAGDAEATYRSAITKYFRPEFMNRIDGIVVFQPLGQEDIRLITLKELEELKQREGFVKKGLQLEFTENAVHYIAGIGFHERYGARPLQRAMENYIVKPLAAWLLKHHQVENRRLKVDFDQKVIIEEV